MALSKCLQSFSRGIFLASANLVVRLFVEATELKKQIFSALKLERRVTCSPPVRILIRCACFRVAPHFLSTTLGLAGLIFFLLYPEPGLLKILKCSPFF